MPISVTMSWRGELVAPRKIFPSIAWRVAESPVGHRFEALSTLDRPFFSLVGRADLKRRKWEGVLERRTSAVNLAQYSEPATLKIAKCKSPSKETMK
jgi:hypothetical protein